MGSPLNVFVDQDLALSNIPYAAASSYQTIGAGTAGRDVESTATPGAALLAFNAGISSGNRYGDRYHRPAGALTATLYSEPNFPPALVRARVRFVNSTIDVAALDVFVNFSKQVSGLAMNTVSAGIELDADPTAGTATSSISTASGSSQISLQLPAVMLLGGQLYTIYVVGPASALAGVVVEDN